MSDAHRFLSSQPGGVSEDDRRLSVSARLGRLQFHRSGKFRVLQFADVQEGPKVSKDTVRLIAAACDAARPDLVIFTGNQIAGYDSAFEKTFRKRRWSTRLDSVYSTGLTMSRWMGDALHGFMRPNQSAVPGQARGQEADSAPRREQELRASEDLVRQTIAQIVQPLVERGVPFAVTYGNHDFQCGLDTDRMDAIYREFPGCLNPESAAAAQSDLPRSLPASGMSDQRAYACEPGTFALPVAPVQGEAPVLGLVLLDSGDYARTGGYGSPSRRGLDFLRRAPGFIGQRSMVFQHMPLPQYYQLLKPVPATTANAIQGYRAFDSACYTLDEAKTLPGSFLGEGVSCPDHDSGEFAILKKADYFALFAGHDHRNGFVGSVDGVTLGVTPTCGFASYGPVPAKRSARLFEFDIRHPHQPRTQLLEFGRLVGRPSSNKAYTFALSHMPVSKGDAFDLLRKPRILAGSLATLAAGLVASLGSSGSGAVGDGERRGHSDR
ncbi:phosphoesterase [Bifidobacterium actinocoloniiforme DSM 22766]|uniref:Phosphoesterase n=1 Tax=Bifidobacterium actinocoloniiforme DSM 22766 TaxID=1437605 RepID=A0A086YYT7_9BIFI|nr:metallophosphoesterase [Bifidobacterium actinocoloniiforme]AKV55954.1 serine/threonine protein phosphatase [Bifidobacterium actinocoloniiforme DSM 22766]KFI39437.1 phosphoesterase [Bifidobacterium actinocoloniiforme DSM 22766]